MDCFIKKIWEEKSDELVHLQFSKFSKGEFKERAMIRAKKSSGKFSINTTPEYSNELVRIVAEKLTHPAKVKGVVISTRDLTGELDFKDKKQFMGIKKYIVDKEMAKEEIINICEQFPKSFIGLSFSTENTELKIKEKAPKSGKPASKGKEEPKIDFCKLKTKDSQIAKELMIESEEFKEIEIKHTFLIEDIIIPEELKQEKDFSKIREMSRRKGKIIRETKIDGKITIQEKNFIA